LTDVIGVEFLEEVVRIVVSGDRDPGWENEDVIPDTMGS
jgi:hypothetical protein